MTVAAVAFLPLAARAARAAPVGAPPTPRIPLTTPVRPRRAPSLRDAVAVAVSPATPTKERVLKRTPVVERQPKQPPMYRLYIYNDPFNKRERVIDVLLNICQGLSFSRAYSAMQEAHEKGRGLVLIIAQEIAEHYCSCINSDIYSTIEPDQ